MKKFRLIKEYPGSPSLGTIVYQHNLETTQRVYKIESTVSRVPLDKHIVEMQPLFWQEITKKDYEILSFVRINSSLYQGIIKTKNSSGNFTFDFVTGNDSEERLLNCSGFAIHSVRRLSDNKIFTLDDKLVFDGVAGKLVRFTLSNGKMYADQVSLSNIHHIEDKLFTTEDGVDIFEGDSYFKVTNDTFILLPMPSASKHESLRSKVFSTREAAREYIILNKPCLSISDIYNNSNLLKDGVICQGLRQHVKLKI